MSALIIEHMFVFFLYCNTRIFDCKSLFFRKFESSHIIAESFRYSQSISPTYLYKYQKFVPFFSTTTTPVFALPVFSTTKKLRSHLALQLDHKTPAFFLCFSPSPIFFYNFIPFFSTTYACKPSIFRVFSLSPLFVPIFSIIKPHCFYNESHFSHRNPSDFLYIVSHLFQQLERITSTINSHSFYY